MLCRAHRSMNDSGCNTGRTRLRNNHAMNSSRCGCSNQCSEILWILNNVQNQNKQRFILLFCRVKNFSNIRIMISADFYCQSLVIFVQLIQLLALNLMRFNLPLPRHQNNLRQFRIKLCGLRNTYLKEVSALHFQHFISGIPPGNPFSHTIIKPNAIGLHLYCLREQHRSPSNRHESDPKAPNSFLFEA